MDYQPGYRTSLAQETLYLFQIPLEEGRASLCFPSDELIGLVTEPPVFWQQTEPEKPQIPDVLVSDYVQIDNFLTVEEKNQLIDYVLQHESAFVPTTTSTDDLDYRRSMIRKNSGQCHWDEGGKASPPNS
jgi:hypothetical protein